MIVCRAFLQYLKMSLAFLPGHRLRNHSSSRIVPTRALECDGHVGCLLRMCFLHPRHDVSGVVDVVAVVVVVVAVAAILVAVIFLISK